MRLMDTERGYVLLTTLVVLIVSVLLAMAFFQWLMSTHTRINVKGTQENLRALASSAVEDGIHRWKQDHHWRAYGTDTSPLWRVTHGDREYTVETEVVRYPDRLRFMATAREDGYEYSDDREGILRSPLIYSVAVNEGFISRGNVRLGGPVYARKNLVLQHPGVIEGNALTQSVVSGSGKVTGTRYNKQRLPSLTFPDIKSYFEDMTYELVEPEITDRGLNRVVVYHEGDLEVRDVDMKKTALIVDGNVTLEGNVNIEAPEAMPAIYASGMVRIRTDGGRIEGLVASQQKIDMEGTMSVKGTVFGRELSVQGNLTVSRDHQLYQTPPKGFKPTVIREPYRPSG